MEAGCVQEKHKGECISKHRAMMSAQAAEKTCQEVDAGPGNGGLRSSVSALM